MHPKLIIVYLEITYHSTFSLRPLQQYISISSPNLCAIVIYFNSVCYNSHNTLLLFVLSKFSFKQNKYLKMSFIFILILSFPLLFTYVCPNFHQDHTLSAKELSLTFCVIQVYQQWVRSIFGVWKKSLSSSFSADIYTEHRIHHNKVNIAIQLVTCIFWFPSAYKSYAYTILWTTNCTIALCLKPIYIYICTLISKSCIAKKG